MESSKQEQEEASFPTLDTFPLTYRSKLFETTFKPKFQRNAAIKQGILQKLECTHSAQ